MHTKQSRTSIFAQYGTPKPPISENTKSFGEQLHLITHENIKVANQRVLNEDEMSELIQKYEEFNWDSPSMEPVFIDIIQVQLQPDEAIKTSICKNNIASTNYWKNLRRCPPTTIVTQEKHRNVTKEHRPITKLILMVPI